MLDSGTQGVAAGDGVLAPAARRERIVAIDALRGVALLGILLINVQYFQGPDRWYVDAGTVWEGTDRLLFFLATWLVEGKFISMFAFLFGLGIAIQTERARDRGHSSTGLLVRRLAVLALFGAIHAVLIWSGDILFTYALVGMVLLLFRNRSAATVRTWAIALWGLMSGILLLLVLLALAVDGEGVLAASAAAADPVTELAESGVEAYTSGSYAQMVAQRVRELSFSAANLPFIAPWVLALMLFGMAAGRSGIVRDLAGHRPLLRRLTWLGLGTGMPLALLGALGVATDAGGSRGSGAGQIMMLVAAPVVALGYLSLGAQVFTRGVDHPLTRRLAATGRMALTNYLLQSVLCTGLYYGFALYGRGSLAGAFGVWAVVSVLQLIWSPWWLARHEQGPMEWLWRRLTYGPWPLSPASPDR